jgi:hypothetical protein
MGPSLVRAVIEGSMSALGQTETRAHRRGMSVLPPGADMSMTGRFAPIVLKNSPVEAEGVR